MAFAIIQISHLSMIPVKSSHKQDRNALTAMQYSGTVLANVIVISWFAMQLHGKTSQEPESSNSDENASFHMRNYPVFQRAGIICLGLGLMSSIVFHICFKLDCQGDPEEKDVQEKKPAGLRVGDWLRNRKFYQTGAVYMLARLFVTIAQVYMPMYINETLNLDDKYIAWIPAVMYAGGFVISSANKHLSQRIGLRPALILGGLLGIAGSVWLYIGQDQIFLD